MSHIITVSAETFAAEVLESPIPVLVDYWAAWCKPCLAIAPMIEELAEEFAGRIKFVKINIEEGNNQQVAIQFAIRGLPTLHLFKNGALEETQVGANISKTQLIKTMLEPHLS